MHSHFCYRQKTKVSNFSCRFLNPNYWIRETSSNKLKKHSVSKTVRINCSICCLQRRIFHWSNFLETKYRYDSKKYILLINYYFFLILGVLRAKPPGRNFKSRASIGTCFCPRWPKICPALSLIRQNCPSPIITG